jgi:hypothetical protein
VPTLIQTYRLRPSRFLPGRGREKKEAKRRRLKGTLLNPEEAKREAKRDIAKPRGNLNKMGNVASSQVLSRGLKGDIAKRAQRGHC